MTVNTNGEHYTRFAGITDEANLLQDIREDVAAIRASQERTEKMVTDFMTAMQNNPMLRAMGAKFGL